MGSGPGCVSRALLHRIQLVGASRRSQTTWGPGSDSMWHQNNAGRQAVFSGTSRRTREAFWILGCDPCPVMTPILRAGGAISLPVLPCLVPGCCAFLVRVLADSDAVSEVLQLCHTPSRSCQVWERFCTGSPCLGAVRRRPLGVSPKSRRSFAWPCGVVGAHLGSVFGSHLVDIATVALWPLLLLQLACCHHWAQHQGPN